MLPNTQEIFRIKIRPNSQTTGFAQEQKINEEIIYCIKIKSAAEKGKANKELIKFLSKQLGITQSAIEIIKGHTTQNKLIKIQWN